VHRAVSRDLHLIQRFADLLNRIPTVEWFDLPDSAANFAGLLRAQLDLRVEARALQRFQTNFRGNAKGVRFPKPLLCSSAAAAAGGAVGGAAVAADSDGDSDDDSDGCGGRKIGLSLTSDGSESVLVETLENGTHMTDLLVLKRTWDAQPHACAAGGGQHAGGREGEGEGQGEGEGEGSVSNQFGCETHAELQGFCKRVGVELVQTFFRMVLVDNFMHSDLHPGNILVDSAHQQAQRRVGEAQQGQQPQQEQQAQQQAQARREPHAPLLVLLDAGLTTELQERDRQNFISLFMAVAEGDGEKCGRLMWEHAPRKQCEDPALFIAGMADLIQNGVARTSFKLHDVQIGLVLQRVLSLVREHRVQVRCRVVLRRSPLTAHCSALTAQRSPLAARYPARPHSPHPPAHLRRTQHGAMPIPTCFALTARRAACAGGQRVRVPGVEHRGARGRVPPAAPGARPVPGGDAHPGRSRPRSAEGGAFCRRGRSEGAPAPNNAGQLKKVLTCSATTNNQLCSMRQWAYLRVYIGTYRAGGSHLQLQP
jgi:hypothetical protein